MVIRLHNCRRRRTAGALTLEVVVAMALLVGALIPIAFSLAYEQKLCRALYYRAVVLELLDGELEVLSAGEWQAFKPGKTEYRIGGPTAEKLPPGRFELEMAPPSIRLRWVPADKGFGGTVERAISLRPIER